jgi:hypothetical protein
VLLTRPVRSGPANNRLPSMIDTVHHDYHGVHPLERTTPAPDTCFEHCSTFDSRYPLHFLIPDLSRLPTVLGRCLLWSSIHSYFKSFKRVVFNSCISSPISYSDSYQLKRRVCITKTNPYKINAIHGTMNSTFFKTT